MTPHEQLECLLVWIREGPHFYGQTAGELDVLLHYLHVVWAKFADREADLQAAQERTREAERGARGLLEDEERSASVLEQGPAVGRVLEYWQQVDRRLAVVARADRW